MSTWFEKIGRRLRLLSVLAFILALAPGSVWAKKLALVVGNAESAGINYELANPVNDATALSKTLTGLGFDVTLLTNAASSSFWPELTKFTDSAEGADATSGVIQR